MDLTLQLKRLGKKKVISVPYQLTTVPLTLKELIVTCVIKEIVQYNTRQTEQTLISFLTPPLIQEQVGSGKVTFGNLETSQLADADKAIERALLAHEDGLYVVFIDGNEMKNGDDAIHLKEGSEISFIRLTFLAGRLS